MKKYVFFNDPGHGWLRVEKRELAELGIADQVSEYSYEKGQYAYLEEDCDAPLFLQALRKKLGQEIRFDDIAEDRYSENTAIRRFGRYRKPSEIRAESLRQRLELNQVQERSGVSINQKEEN